MKPHVSEWLPEPRALGGGCASVLRLEQRAWTEVVVVVPGGGNHCYKGAGRKEPLVPVRLAGWPDWMMICSEHHQRA